MVLSGLMPDMINVLICCGGATLTKTLESCTLRRPHVVDIQTAHCATLMSTMPQALLRSRSLGESSTCSRQDICGSRTET